MSVYLAPHLLRDKVVASVLSHFDDLRRHCRASRTDQAAAEFLRARIHGGVGAAWGSWQATQRGVAYCGPDARPHDPGAKVIPWIAIARAARTDSEQLRLEVSA